MVRAAVLALLLQAFAARAEPLAIPAADVADAASPAPVFYLVAIGVAAFDDDFWPRLKWPEEDARAVSTAFGRDTGSERHVTLLLGRAATLATVRKALDEVQAQARPRDIVAIYASTHGTLAPGAAAELAAFLVLRDTTAADPGKTGISEAELRRRLDAMPAARKLLVLAACHSGAGKSRFTPRVADMLAGQKGAAIEAPLATVSEGTLILGASSQSEAAREDDDLKGDIYTHYFLEGLQVYDRNHDGMVTALEAHDYAKERTYERSGGRQRPTAEAVLIGDADVPLAGRRVRSGLPVFEAYGEDLRGLSVRMKGPDAREATVRLPGGAPLTAGITRMDVYKEDAEKPLAAFRVRANAGEIIALDELFAGPPWSLRLRIAGAAFTDPRARRLAPRAGIAALEIVRKFGDHASFALGADTVSTGERSRPTAIKLALKESGATISPGYRWRLGPDDALRAELLLSRRSAALAVSDEGGPDRTEQRRASATGWGAALVAERALYYGLGVEIGLRYLAVRFDFGDLGGLARARLEASAGLSYDLGLSSMRVRP